MLLLVNGLRTNTFSSLKKWNAARLLVLIVWKRYEFNPFFPLRNYCGGCRCRTRFSKFPLSSLCSSQTQVFSLEKCGASFSLHSPEETRTVHQKQVLSWFPWWSLLTKKISSKCSHTLSDLWIRFSLYNENLILRLIYSSPSLSWFTKYYAFFSNSYHEICLLEDHFSQIAFVVQNP